MKLTQELIDQIQEAMLHTKKDGSINWKDDDEVMHVDDTGGNSSDYNSIKEAVQTKMNQ